MKFSIIATCLLIQLTICQEDPASESASETADSIQSSSSTIPSNPRSSHAQNYKPIKSCFYCRESSMGYCAANEVDNIMDSCPGFLPQSCTHEKNIEHLNITTKEGVAQVTAHLGRAKTQLQCGDQVIAGCDQVDRGESEATRIFLCCSTCTPAAGMLVGSGGSNLGVCVFSLIVAMFVRMLI